MSIAVSWIVSRRIFFEKTKKHRMETNWTMLDYSTLKPFSSLWLSISFKKSRMIFDSKKRFSFFKSFFLIMQVEKGIWYGRFGSHNWQTDPLYWWSCQIQFMLPLRDFFFWLTGTIICIRIWTLHKSNFVGFALSILIFLNRI